MKKIRTKLAQHNVCENESFFLCTLGFSFISSEKTPPISPSSNNGPRLVSHLGSCLNHFTHIYQLVATVVVAILLNRTPTIV